MHPTNPHDRLFRGVFSQPEHAAGELRSLLPVEVARRIDWSTLQPLPESFIDPGLAELRADLVFSVKLDGRAAYFYVLLEHQSTADRLMPLRVLRYMIQIWDGHLRASADTDADAGLLPPIIPVVVHHSARGWTAPVAFSELLDVPADLRASLGRYLPSFEFLLDDLSAVQDEALRGRAISTLARVALNCLARARTSSDFLSELRRWTDALAELLEAQNGIAALSMLVSYILQVTDTPPEQLREMLNQLGPKAEEAYMTGEQMLVEKRRAEWLEQGRAEGRSEGRNEGRAEGRAEALLRH